MGARKDNVQQIGKTGLKDLEADNRRQEHCTPTLSHFSNLLSAQFASPVLYHSLNKHFKGERAGSDDSN